MLQENSKFVSAALDLHAVQFLNVEDAADVAEIKDKKKAGAAVPGNPSFQFFFSNA
jgi:hypothetical protein